MTRHIILLVALLSVLASMAMCASKNEYIKTDSVIIRILTSFPATGVNHTADILYVHGFADRADNHYPLFNEWNAKGFRVIAFDLPNHGESTGEISNFPFERLAKLAYKVYTHATQSDRVQMPLILSGWSTGGLLVTRILQKYDWRFGIFESKITGAILFAPGVSVHLLVGDNGMVTEQSLTSNPNPPHMGPIRPKTPLTHPIFASMLLLNSECSMNEMIDLDIPVLTFIAGDETDKYVVSANLRKWVQKQYHWDVKMNAVRCPYAKHELDNEIEPIGRYIRQTAVDFAEFIMSGRRVWTGPSTKSAFCDRTM